MTLLDTPSASAELVNQGDEFRRRDQLVEAERCYRDAAAADPHNGMALARLGSVLERSDDASGAIDAYQRALDCAQPPPRSTRRSLVTLLVRQGRIRESRPYWQAEFDEDDDGLGWMQRTINAALTRRDLSLAGIYAETLAALQWGIGFGAPSLRRPARYYPPSIPKLRHDVQQFHYLQRTGILGSELDEPIRLYQSVIEHLESIGPNARLALDCDMMDSIRHTYNRIISRPDVARVARALSGQWDPTEVERAYLGRPPGVVFVDNFLTPEALSGLRRFCLESTVWSANRYAHGRLGAFFQDGFNCPLLLQIAEELRAALPRVIGDRYPVQQIWGFKCGPTLPADATTHADFAAVNVNFWITPNDANTDPDSGGLTIYNVDAPLSWDFDTYNGRSDIIKPFLTRQNSRAMTIPYRANRAIIFNSDLFHGTDRVAFRPGFENLRVNITMLYGKREDEVHHRELHAPDPTEHILGVTPPWRSQAFRTARRRKT